MAALRLPDYVIIGTQKSGTTSLHHWLGQQPECWVPAIKEPHFFSDDQRYAAGLESYAALFADAPPGALVGEASASYTGPPAPGVSIGGPEAAVVAERMASVLPRARLIYILREPVERVRSEFRHQVQKNRERRSLAEALADESSAYVARSMYYRCLAPFIDRFPREQICVVRFEDVVGSPAPGWDAVLDHLGLARRPVPDDHYNLTEAKPQFTPLLRWLVDTGLQPALRWTPSSLKRRVRPLLFRNSARYRSRLDESRAPIPTAIVERLAADADRLAQWMGRSEPLWEMPRADATPSRAPGSAS